MEIRHYEIVTFSLGLHLVLRLWLTCSKRVQEEKELANSSADVEGVEGFLQPVELWQGGDQLQDVVLQILQSSRKGQPCSQNTKLS